MRLTRREKKAARAAKFLALPNGDLAWGTKADGL